MSRESAFDESAAHGGGLRRGYREESREELLRRLDRFDSAQNVRQQLEALFSESATTAELSPVCVHVAVKEGCDLEGTTLDMSRLACHSIESRILGRNDDEEDYGLDADQTAHLRFDALRLLEVRCLSVHAVLHCAVGLVLLRATFI